MAEPNKGVITYRDQAGKTATSEVFFTTGLTLAQITQGMGAGLGALIDAVTGALITAINILIGCDISGLTGNTTGVTGDVDEVGEFIFRTAAGRKVLVNVPAIVNVLSTPGTDDLDQSNAHVAAFISAMEDGIAVTGGTIIPVDAGGDDVVEIVTARERVRNSGSRR
jgi:hypothetical protein